MSDYESIHTSDTLTKSVFSFGTRCVFYQVTAPVNWILDSSIGDTLLGINSTAGSWDQTAHVHTTGGHTLALNEMGYHNHQYWQGGVRTDGEGHWFYNYKYNVLDSWDQDYQTGVVGGGGSHEHGDTYSGNEANTWRPAAMVCGIFEKGE